MPFNALLNLFRKQPPPSPPQEILRAPTWYENALLTATSPNIPQENALVTAMDRLTAASAIPAKNYITTGQASPQDVIQGLTGQKRGEWTDVIASRYPNLNPFLQKAYGFGMNVLTDPTNLMPGAMMAGEIKNVRHVSPHLFDKFDLSRIGTGEGHQAFGHGLYFTESDDVAKNYIEKFGSGNPSLLMNEQATLSNVAKKLNISEAEASVLLQKFGYSPGNEATLAIAIQNNAKAGHLRHTGASDLISTPKVYEYEATIAKGRPHTMLQWDKPVTKAQWNKIRSQAIKEGIDDIDAIMGKVFDEPGSYVYYNLSDAITRKLNAKAGGDVFRDDPKLASEFLKRAGIDGIEYPSGTLSGIKDSPHKNYVVFDDADITIEKRTPR